MPRRPAPSPSARPAPSERVAPSLIFVFLLALALRLLHVWQIRPTPYFDVLLGDAHGYDEWARRIAAGDWWGSEVFYQAPLYPYVLGVLYTLAGPNLLVVRIAQAVIGSASCVLLGAAAGRLFGSRAGLLAGLGLALYAPAIFFDGLLQKSVLDVFFVCLALWIGAGLATHGQTMGRWLALGLAMGGLSLTRENALVFVVVLAVWALVQSGLPRLRAAGAFALGLALVLLPVAARNYSVGGGFYLTTSQFGPNFYIGNHAGADGTYVSLRPGRGAPEYERQDATELAEQALQRPLTPAEVSSYWTSRAVGFITSDPGGWLALMARKAALLVNTSEMLDTESQESYAEVSWPLRLLGPVGHFGVLVPLALFGFVVTWPDRRRLWPWLAMAGAYAASVVAFYVFARYRFPLVPFLLLFGAAGLSGAAAWMAGASRGRVAGVGIALLALAAVVNWPLLPAARMQAITENNLATALHEAGRDEDALVHFRKAIALKPDYTPAYNNLGVTLRAMGRTDEAIAAYQQGLAQGDYADLHFNLANALIAAGRSAEAEPHLKQAMGAGRSGSAGAHNNLGMALAEQGRVAEAEAEFRAALAADPASVTALRNLGNLLASAGRPADALASLSKAAELAPGDADARYDLGSLLLEHQRYADAEAEFRAALAVRPNYPEALNNLGIALGSEGRLADAVAAFERAVALRPGFDEARRNLETARAALKQ